MFAAKFCPQQGNREIPCEQGPLGPLGPHGGPWGPHGGPWGPMGPLGAPWAPWGPNLAKSAPAGGVHFQKFHQNWHFWGPKWCFGGPRLWFWGPKWLEMAGSRYGWPGEGWIQVWLHPGKAGSRYGCIRGRHDPGMAASGEGWTQVWLHPGGWGAVFQAR